MGNWQPCEPLQGFLGQQLDAAGAVQRGSNRLVEENVASGLSGDLFELPQSFVRQQLDTSASVRNRHSELARDCLGVGPCGEQQGFGQQLGSASVDDTGSTGQAVDLAKGGCTALASIVLCCATVQALCWLLLAGRAGRPEAPEISLGRRPRPQ